MIDISKIYFYHPVPCKPGHPALPDRSGGLGRKGGEIFAVLIYFEIQNMIEARISPPGQESPSRESGSTLTEERSQGEVVGIYNLLFNPTNHPRICPQVLQK